MGTEYDTRFGADVYTVAIVATELVSEYDDDTNSTPADVKCSATTTTLVHQMVDIVIRSR